MTEAAPEIKSDRSTPYQPMETGLLAEGRLFRSVSYGIAMAVLMVIFSLTPFAHRIEHRYGLGLLFELRRPVVPPQGALIVAINRDTIAWLREISAQPPDAASRLVACLPDRALNELGRLKGPGSLPRSLHACLLNELNRIGFPVVAFDILFSVAGIAEDDMMLARAVRTHGATAILVGLERYTVEDGGAELLVQREIQPLPLFEESAAATGSFLVPRSGGPVYGYWRQVPGFGETRSLVEEAFYIFRSLKSDTSSGEQQDSEFAYLWFYGAPGSIETLSIRDILSGEIPEAVRVSAADTAVFIGASDPKKTDFPDSFPSWYRGKTGADISGVEIAATAFLNLHAGHDLRRLSWPAEVSFLGLFAFALSLVARAATGYNLLAIPGIAMVYLIAAVAAFSQFQLFLPIVTPVFVAAPTAFVVAVLVRSSIARSLIMRLAPAPIARRMLAQSTSHRGVIVSHDATVVFFDLIGSTTIGERLPELDFGALINSYHDTVTREVESHGGFVVAFAGDGVTAVFDSSNAGSDHALLACRSVISTIRKIRNLNLENVKRGFPPLGVRIGLNSGRVAEGGIGAQDRFNFSVVGDVVNLASRLEQLGKKLFPNEKDVILVGMATHRMVQGHELSFVDCGPHPIAGRKIDENIFRLLVD